MGGTVKMVNLLCPQCGHSWQCERSSICGCQDCPTAEQVKDVIHAMQRAKEELGIAKKELEEAELKTNAAEETLQSVYASLIALMAEVVDRKDHDTHRHSQRVTLIAVQIGVEMGIDREQSRLLKRAAELHDIGKLEVPDYILRKPGKLTEEERKIINKHPATGADLLDHLKILRDLVPIVVAHHEHYDGSGYPYGKKGDEVPMLAYILAVADAIDAMQLPRPYRPGLSYNAIRAELLRCRGTQFHPDVVDAALKVDFGQKQ